jgi:signal transduction histidine kinase
VPTDVNRVADEVVGLFQETARKDGVDLRIERSGTIEAMSVDPKDIHTCLVNLVSNAIDACMEKGPEDGELAVTVRVIDEDDKVVLEVADTGCGMDQRTKNKVFSTFFTTKGLEGNGLGLLVTRKLVHAHGGSVSVESEPDQGSTFRVELPKGPRNG